MKRIKILGFIIIVLLVGLFFVSLKITDYNQKITNIKDTINIQKFITQDISKEIIYLYKNSHIDYNHLKNSLDIFKINLDNIKDKKIKQDSKNFLKIINKFQNQLKNKTAYSTVIVDKIVQKIYLLTFDILKSCNKYLELESKICKQTINIEKNIQNIIFILLFIIFGYFIVYILKYKSNFEILIEKLERSINSIDNIEQTVEKYLQETPNIQDEDLIIESLEELMNSSIRLKQLQSKLNKN